MKKIIWLFLILLLVGCSKDIVEPVIVNNFELLSTNKITNLDMYNRQWISFELCLISNLSYSISELQIIVTVYPNYVSGGTTLYTKINPGDIVCIEVALFNIQSHEDYDFWDYELRYQ